MNTNNGLTHRSRLQKSWRHLVLILVVLSSLAAILSHEPVGQDPAYHEFADRRTLAGVPNFFDVVSNLPFLIIGIAGVVFCLRNSLGALRYAWIAFFTGVALVSFGSAYYHWNPTSQTLVWDRFPMTAGFMGFFAALLGEHVREKLGGFLLAPLVLLGFSSVVYWRRFDDLRFYFWIQLIPLLVIPILMVLFRSRHSHHWLLGAALASYILAKVSEVHDPEILGFTHGLFSGHSLKHLLAALGCFAILGMLKARSKTSNRARELFIAVNNSVQRAWLTPRVRSFS